MIVRPISPTKARPHVFNVKAMTLISGATPIPVGISQDHSTIYGGASNVLSFSTNDGTSWTAAHTFPSGNDVVGIAETDDGEALVICQNVASAPGYVFKSSGWATSKTAATWTLVLTSQSAAYFRNGWGLNSSSFGTNARVAGSGAIGVISEYGSQTPTAGAATRVYLTTNYGATWSIIYDLVTQYPGLNVDHTLCCAYDPYWDRIIVCHQTIPNPTTTRLTYIDYSDDHGNTWNTIPLPSWVNPSVGTYMAQNTNLCVLEDAYLLQSDHQGPGLIRIPRLGYRQLGNPYTVTSPVGHSASQGIGWQIYRRRGAINAPIISTLSPEANIVSPLIFASFDGLEFVEVWRNDLLKPGSSDGGQGGGTKLFSMFGPTQAGNYVGQFGSANETGLTTNLQIVGELIKCASGDYGQYLTVTGDGATTVFSFAHGMQAPPSRYFVVPQTFNAVAAIAANSPVVTVTSTNIVLTFPTAPANAAVLGYAARYS